ncbi:Ribosomal RNA large subunit methyltransferase [Trichinella pseudospiralis]
MAASRTWRHTMEPPMAIPSTAPGEMVAKLETRISVGTDAATEMEIFPSGARSERFGADPGGQHPASPVPNRRDYGIALGQRWHREIGQDPDVDQRDHAASDEARPTRTDNCQ